MQPEGSVALKGGAQPQSSSRPPFPFLPRASLQCAANQPASRVNAHAPLERTLQRNFGQGAPSGACAVMHHARRNAQAGQPERTNACLMTLRRTLVASGCSLDHGGNDAGSAPSTSDMDVDMVATAAEPLASADESQADSDVEHLDVARAYQHMRERRSTEGGSASQALDLVPFNSRLRSLSGPNVMWQQLAANGPAMLMHMGPALREQMLQAVKSDNTQALVLGAQPLLPLTRQPTLCIVEEQVST